MPKRIVGRPLLEEAPGRMVNTKHLVGVGEGAAFFNVNPSTFSNWSAQRHSNRMPLPVRVLASGTFYDLQELLTWWVDWSPVKGAKTGTIDPRLVLELGLEVTL